MAALLTVIFLLVATSFTCSILESVILSINKPYIELLRQRGEKAGEILRSLKGDIDEPLSAILTLNTISNTAGAAVAGGLALEIFGSRWMALFSGVLTLLILVFSEIVPKTLGANYWKALSTPAAWVLRVLVVILKPITIPVNLVARVIARNKTVPRVTKDEVLTSVRVGFREGAVEQSEYRIVENLFRLNKVTVHDIMTPRKVVVWFSPGQTLEELVADGRYLRFSRIPLYNVRDDRIEGVVLRRDVMRHLAREDLKIPLKELAHDPEFVDETMSVYDLLDRFISRKVHLAAVLDEFGEFAGIVTMEDALETLLGREIIDETDSVVDMRELARKSGQRPVE
ncbi:MAG: DUF21 domain-containing protein [Chitinivibrionales bacterium]|nr:DUF21 domain-containing protein [Chitinivibrionales bacterium]MBD3357249.1 DUF21 domain-containing protein [Chitinivibrionales bacterium]